MKLCLVLLALAAAVAVTYAGPEQGGNDVYGYGYGDAEGYNARRQLYVNEVARRQNAGVGTADKEGVPGTRFDRRNALGYNGFYGYPGAFGYGYGYGRADPYYRGY